MYKTYIYIYTSRNLCLCAFFRVDWKRLASHTGIYVHIYNTDIIYIYVYNSQFVRMCVLTYVCCGFLGDQSAFVGIPIWLWSAEIIVLF